MIVIREFDYLSVEYGMGSYIGFEVTMTADNATNRIFISLGEPYDLFGWNN